MLAAGGISGSLLIYDLRKIQAPLFRLSGHDTPIKSVFFSERQKDKQKQKIKPKQFGTSSNLSKTGNSYKDIPQSINNDSQQQKGKPLTPVISSNKLIGEQQKSYNQKAVVRNLTKKQQLPNQSPQIIQQRPSTQAASQQQATIYRPTTEAGGSKTIQSGSTTNLNNVTTTTYQRTTTYQPSSTSVYQQVNAHGPQLKSLEEKLTSQMKNMQMRMNQKFESLHLQIIRQMQLSVQKMAISFEKKFSQQKELENRIRQLEEQNQNLRKRTY